MTEWIDALFVAPWAFATFCCHLSSHAPQEKELLNLVAHGFFYELRTRPERQAEGELIVNRYLFENSEVAEIIAENLQDSFSKEVIDDILEEAHALLKDGSPKAMQGPLQVAMIVLRRQWVQVESKLVSESAKYNVNNLEDVVARMADETSERPLRWFLGLSVPNLPETANKAADLNTAVLNEWLLSSDAGRVFAESLFTEFDEAAVLAYFAYAHAHAISLVPFFRNIVSTEINQNRIALMLGGDEVDVDDVLPYYGVCWKTYHIYLSYSLREWGAVNLRPILDKLYTSDFDPSKVEDVLAMQSISQRLLEAFEGTATVPAEVRRQVRHLVSTCRRILSVPHNMAILLARRLISSWLLLVMRNPRKLLPTFATPPQRLPQYRAVDLVSDLVQHQLPNMELTSAVDATLLLQSLEPAQAAFVDMIAHLFATEFELGGEEERSPRAVDEVIDEQLKYAVAAQLLTAHGITPLSLRFSHWPKLRELFPDDGRPSPRLTLGGDPVPINQSDLSSKPRLFTGDPSSPRIVALASPRFVDVVITSAPAVPRSRSGSLPSAKVESQPRAARSLTVYKKSSPSSSTELGPMSPLLEEGDGINGDERSSNRSDRQRPKLTRSHRATHLGKHSHDKNKDVDAVEAVNMRKSLPLVSSKRSPVDDAVSPRRPGVHSVDSLDAKTKRSSLLSLTGKGLLSPMRKTKKVTSESMPGSPKNARVKEGPRSSSEGSMPAPNGLLISRTDSNFILGLVVDQKPSLPALEEKWQRPCLATSLHADIPRLMNKLQVARAGKVIWKLSSDKGQPVDHVNDLLSCLQSELSPEQSKKTHTLLPKTKVEEQGDIQTALRQLLTSDISESSGLMKLLKASCNQAIVAPVWIWLKMSLLSQYPFKDKPHGWLIHVEFLTDKIIITHSKEELSGSEEKAVRFEFEWQLSMTFSRDMVAMTNFSYGITALAIAENCPLSVESTIRTLLEPYRVKSLVKREHNFTAHLSDKHVWAHSFPPATPLSKALAVVCKSEGISLLDRAITTADKKKIDNLDAPISKYKEVFLFAKVVAPLPSTFTIVFDDGTKKAVIYQPNMRLPELIEKICNARGVPPSSAIVKCLGKEMPTLNVTLGQLFANEIEVSFKHED